MFRGSRSMLLTTQRNNWFVITRNFYHCICGITSAVDKQRLTTIRMRKKDLTAYPKAPFQTTILQAKKKNPIWGCFSVSNSSCFPKGKAAMTGSHYPANSFGFQHRWNSWWIFYTIALVKILHNGGFSTTVIFVCVCVDFLLNFWCIFDKLVEFLHNFWWFSTQCFSGNSEVFLVEFPHNVWQNFYTILPGLHSTTVVGLTCMGPWFLCIYFFPCLKD